MAAFNKPKIIALITLIIFIAVLSGCGGVASDGGEETELKVIIHGKVVNPDDEENLVKSEYASFYIPEGMVTDYGLEDLSVDMRRIYDNARRHVGNFEPSAPLEADGSEYWRLLNRIRLSELSYSHLTGYSIGDYKLISQSFEVLFEYQFSPEEMSRMNHEAEQVADLIFESIPAGATEYEKLKYFHDYLITNCVSDTEDALGATIYGTLVNGRALCEGYAKTFSYLCNRAGIENAIAIGETTVPHMWNMVKTGGNWYHVDVTLDNPDAEAKKRLPGLILYQYFMVTDSVIENNRAMWDYLYSYPRALTEKENYFAKENLKASTVDQAFEVIRHGTLNAASSGKRHVMVKFDTTNLFLTFKSRLGSASALSDVAEEIKSLYGKDVFISWSDYYEDYRILTFIIEYS